MAGSDDLVNMVDKQDCYLMGWGAMCTNNTVFPDNLRELRYNLLSSEQCRIYHPVLFDNSEMLCCGDLNNKTGSGFGDSGAPVICSMRSNPPIRIMIGLLSMGFTNCLNGPDLIVRVSRFLDWITHYADNTHLNPPRNPYIPRTYNSNETMF